MSDLDPPGVDSAPPQVEGDGDGLTWRRAHVYKVHADAPRSARGEVLPSMLYFGLTCRPREREAEQTFEPKPGNTRQRRQSALPRRFNTVALSFRVLECPVYSYYHGRLREMVCVASQILLRGGLDLRRCDIPVCGGPWLFPVVPAQWPEREQTTCKAVMRVVLDARVSGFEEEKKGSTRVLMQTGGIPGRMVTMVGFEHVKLNWPDMAACIDEHEPLQWFLKSGSAPAWLCLLTWQTS